MLGRETDFGSEGPAHAATQVGCEEARMSLSIVPRQWTHRTVTENLRAFFDITNLTLGKGPFQLLKSLQDFHKPAHPLSTLKAS